MNVYNFIDMDQSNGSLDAPSILIISPVIPSAMQTPVTS